MKKLFISLLSVVLLAGCSSTTNSTENTTSAESSEVVAIADGSYTGTARGNNGDITVNTTFKDGKIESIEIVSQEETQGISNDPIEQMGQRIVDAQSIAVDTFSGATMTSRGIINAVSNSIENAGGNLDDWKTEVEITVEPVSDTTCDIVVIGSGASGMTSAIYAAQNGANVILVEKQDILGGTSLLSASMFGSVGTRVHIAEGKTETTEDLYENYLKPEAATGGLIADSEAAKVLAENSTAAAEYLLDLGVDFDHTSSKFILAPASGKRVGAMVIPALTSEMKKANVDVRKSTKATKLLLDDGKASGIEVETKDGQTYTINAKAVVIATGGFAASKEMVSKYLPEWSNSIYYCSPGDTGDGIVMAQEVGLDITDLTVMKANPLVFYDGTKALTMNSAVKAGAIMVNHEGVRFANEQGSYGISPKINSQTNGEGIVIFDNTLVEQNDEIKEYLEKGYLTEASSLDELAEKLDIDADALKETVATYQEEVVNGEDTEFGRSTLADLYSGDTFYGIVVKPSIQGTFGGIHTNVNTEVYNTDGDIVPGMYAVGECAQEGLNGLNPMTVNLVFGKICGENAATYIQSAE